MKLPRSFLLSSLLPSLLPSLLTQVACTSTSVQERHVPPPASAAPSKAPQTVTSAEHFGERVHPECLWNLLEGESIKLSECEASPGEVSRDEDGVGFVPSGNEYGEGGGYEVLGFVAGNAVVSASYHTGGTGRFTTLGFFELKYGTLTLKNQVVRGDRCHGGIHSVTLDGDQLTYEVAITPHALIALGGFEELDVDKGYPDLWDSASTCIGSLTKDAFNREREDGHRCHRALASRRRRGLLRQRTSRAQRALV